MGQTASGQGCTHPDDCSEKYADSLPSCCSCESEYTTAEPLPIIKPEQNTPEMVHHEIEWNGSIHPVDIPIEADKALLDELGTMEVDLCATIVDAQKTAFLLFANYLDAATEIAESCGGGAHLKATGVEKTMRMIWSGRVAALDRHVRCTSVLYVVHEECKLNNDLL